MTHADMVRALKIHVGDTIEGREGKGPPGWWQITRLTLLWLGEEVAVWRETSRSQMSPEWSTPRESANWTLSCRDWKKV